jgi:ubiquinone/menaquinone biosynthesis C-methylase UbiE
VDISPNQIALAQENALKNRLNINFSSTPAENIDFPANYFDIISSSMSWMYFDIKKVLPKIRQTLKSSGVLAKCSFVWLPFEDEIAYNTEKLVLKFNPNWSGAGYKPKEYTVPEWSKPFFTLKTFHTYKESIRFTGESWRGRIRACSGIGASLPEEKIRVFDNELNTLLSEKYESSFTILHQIKIEVFEMN